MIIKTTEAIGAALDWAVQEALGSMVYLLKTGRPNVSMRLGAALKILSYDEMEAQSDLIISPESLNHN